MLLAIIAHVTRSPERGADAASCASCNATRCSVVASWKRTHDVVREMLRTSRDTPSRLSRPSPDMVTRIPFFRQQQVGRRKAKMCARGWLRGHMDSSAHRPTPRRRRRPLPHSKHTLGTARSRTSSASRRTHTFVLPLPYIISRPTPQRRALGPLHLLLPPPLWCFVAPDSPRPRGSRLPRPPAPGPLTPRANGRLAAQHRQLEHGRAARGLVHARVAAK